MAESFGILNTNLAAQQAYFYLQNNTNKLNEASDKVASGLRVRSSQDDPAGYIQITRFKSVIAGLQTARQNVGSATSLTGIVNGGLESIRALLLMRPRAPQKEMLLIIQSNRVLQKSTTLSARRHSVGKHFSTEQRTSPSRQDLTLVTLRH